MASPRDLTSGTHLVGPHLVGPHLARPHLGTSPRGASLRDLTLGPHLGTTSPWDLTSRPHSLKCDFEMPVSHANTSGNERIGLNIFKNLCMAARAVYI